MIKKGSLFLTAFSFTMCITTLNQSSAYASSLTPVKNVSWTIQNEKMNIDKPLIRENIYLPERKYVDTYTIKTGDSIKQLLRRSQIDPVDIKEFVYNTPTADKLFKISVGQNIKIERDQNNYLTRIIIEKDSFNTIQAIKNNEGRFTITEKQKEYEMVKKYVSGTIVTTLSDAAKNSGLNYDQIHELTDIFNWDIDFRYDVKAGDTFSLIYEDKVMDDVVIDKGKIIAAEFKLSGKEYTAFAYTVNGTTKYYDKNGNSLEKAFLRNPIDIAKVSSTFNNQRLHPIFNKIKAHKGTDYAASPGTPIKNTGDGVVTFIGKQNGYGNVVMIDHGMNYSTVYAHMRGFQKGLKKGDAVKQGEIIGFVGSTGYATGPHLHYEFRIDGMAQNSLTVELPNSKPIDSRNFIAFKSEVNKLAINMNKSKGQIGENKEFAVAKNIKNSKYFE